MKKYYKKKNNNDKIHKASMYKFVFVHENYLIFEHKILVAW